MSPFDSISSSVAGAVGKASQAGLKQAKRGKVVARVNTKRSKERRQGQQERQAPAGILSAKDMIQLFQSMPVPNRGYRNPPPKMGGGLDWLDSKNSQEQVAARQNRVNTEQAQIRNNAQEAARSAVAEAKVRQGMPVAAPSSKYGTGSVSFFQPGEARPTATTTDPLTGKKVPLRSFLDDTMDRQELKYGPGINQVPVAASRVASTPAASNQEFDSLFAGGAPAKPTPSTFQPVKTSQKPTIMTGQLPEFSNPGMPLPEAPQMYDYLDPASGLYKQGTLFDIEKLRRANRGAVPRIFDSIEAGATGMEQGIVDLLRKLFGNPNPVQPL